MHDRKMLPEEERPEAQVLNNHQSVDGIEIPPLPVLESTFDTGISGDSRQESKAGRLPRMIKTAVLLAALIAGGWLMTRGPSAEKQHSNWKYVTAATEASQHDQSCYVQVDAAERINTLSSIEISARDADRATTRVVRSALLRNNLAAANAGLLAAQRIPASPGGDIRQPEISPNSDLASAIKERRQEFFQIYLFDCCDEDGDVLEILTNGTAFGTVPLTHQGTLLSIPLHAGNNTLTLRGVSDGGGGITVSFQTSRGQYFCRSMQVGEEYSMGVLVK